MKRNESGPRTVNKRAPARLSPIMPAFAALLVFAFALPGMANFSGAIFTTISTGTTVNGNLYNSKDAVYLNGGPQNQNSAGLPSGVYYFQVTDPSGATLLSNDDISCRQVVVNNGSTVINGPTGPCPHSSGTPNLSNNSTPVQPIPYNDTSNQGGEYKVWLTPVDKFDTANCTSHFGFCDSDSKTDNFKVIQPGAAYVTVCKFNDVNGNHTQDTGQPGEPLIAHWPINSTGFDIGQELQQTDDNGCVSFAYSGFTDSHSSQGVTLTEGTFGPDWQQTAPVDGTYNSGTFTVTSGVISVTLHPGDNLTAPNFGNQNPVCGTSCALTDLVVTKDANPSFKRTFKWTITKDVDKTTIKQSGTSATFNYTVNVTHDSGTDSDWKVTGTIRVSNPGGVDVAATVTDAVGTGVNCSVTGGGPPNNTIPHGNHMDLPYTCTYSSAPSPSTGTNTASTTFSPTVGTANFDFSGATVIVADGTATITDTLGGSLGTVSSTDPSPKQFKYSKTVTGTAGTCVSQDNTATFTTNSTATTGSASQTVKLCVGADLTVSKTATPAYNSNITKDVNKTKVEQAGGTATFTYTVKVTESGWKVSGNITVANPNDWESITANIADTIDKGGSCTVTGGTAVSVAASSSVTVPYSCTFSSAPTGTSGTNTGTATWTGFYTPNASGSGTKSYNFASLTVTDPIAPANTFSPIAGNKASTTFTYTRTVNNTTGGACQKYDNTATIVATSQTASQSVNICNTATGGLTMGFWQNNNGQAIITGGTSAVSVCNSGTWLRQYAPFQDLSSTASCAAVATYVFNLIKAANASGASMNAILKAQMLATALDTYFSNPALGGNKIGAATPLGGVKIDLTHVCPVGSATCSSASSAFGGTPSLPVNSLTVLKILAYAASQSNVGGSTWYANVKSTQELAKNTFDDINNQVAFIVP